MPSRPSRNLAGTAVLAIITLLSACQSLTPEDPPPVEFRRSLVEKKKDGCQDDNCALVNLDLLQFPTEPALDRLIDERLRSMTRYAPEDPIPATLTVYQNGFLTSAEPGWGSWLQAKVRDWHGQVLVIELSSYLFEGGAHGHPGRGFINYQLEQNRELKLQDMLVPGTEGKFWRIVQQAHREWVRKNHADQALTFLETWPFQRTLNIALLRNHVQLKYDVATIAPYADGHPELNIPYAKLEGVIRSEYRGGDG
ncbi:RsiV family protein [Azomonas macrocytogenes]|uniref:DUF3298 domain-containing protein n=1 Tax=Azomonas macrocytogenes TaxID=69962 RepID=A0A839T1K2_AZOMA|nr:RsiV family protein [Azomonas macrocytogenes]MBB3102480.1 hypothetical protein [Azomonas macrocytogenes]